MDLTYTQGSLSLTLQDVVAHALAPDGGLQVQVDSSGAWVDGLAGAVWNPRGTNLSNAIHSSTLPRRGQAGDILVLASPSTGPSRDAYWPGVEGRSSCDEMMVVSFVNHPPEGTLRAYACGDGALVRLGRGLGPIHVARVEANLHLLPNLIDIDLLPIDWTSWGQGKPTLDYYERLFGAFRGELYDGWSTDTKTPDSQHPGYGREVALVTSQALCMLCSTAPRAAKLRLATLMVQAGLDLLGAYADGRNTASPENGHSQGRKALCVLAGMLLDVPILRDPTALFGPVFNEDGAYYARSPYAWWQGWQYGWLPHGTQRFTHKHPSEWTTHDRGEAWGLRSYGPHCWGANVGTALAMRLMGLEREMGTAFCGMIRQWMSGPDALAIGSNAVMQAAGVDLPWGTDYSVSRAVGFCAEAYRKYAP